MDDKTRLYGQVASALEDECTFFLGSGFSQEAGLPGAEELVRVIMREPSMQDSTAKSLDEVATQWLQRTKKSKLLLHEIVREAIQEGQEHMDIEKVSALRDIPVRSIITTNYDTVIEQVLGPQSVTTIRRSEDIPKSAIQSKVQLYKPYGDLDDLGSYVLTRQDFADWKTANKLVSNKIELLLAEHPLVVLGSSGRDPNLAQWLAEVGREIPLGARHPVFVVAREAEHVGDVLAAVPQAVFIPASTGEFLAGLVGAHKDRLKSKPAIYPGLSNVEKDAFGRRKNPFMYYDADNIISYQDIESLFYYENSIMGDILGPTNVLVSGSRGTGKSMILKYAAAASSTAERANQVGFIGLYVKWAVTDVIACQRRQGESQDSWETRFSYWALLFISEAILEHISKPEITIFRSCDKPATCKKIGKLLGLTGTFRTFQDLREEITLRKSTVAGARGVKNSRGLDTLYPVCSLLLRCAKDRGVASHVRIALLFDEYDRLDQDQRPIVSSLIASKKEPILVKLSISAFTLAEQGNRIFAPYTLQPINDYTAVHLDETLLARGPTKSIFRSYAENVLDKRRQLAGIRLKPVELFPHDPNYKYSGLSQFIRISSGQIRWPIEIAKDILMKVVRDSSLSSISEPISPKLQSEVVEVHSSIFFQQLLDTAEGASRIESLVETMCEYFKQRSRNSEQRTLRFVIRDRDHLSEDARKALDGGLACGLLLIANVRRRQAPHEGVPHTAFRVHRILCPRFELELDDHHQREFTADEINLIFKDRREFLSRALRRVVGPGNTQLDSESPEVAIEESEQT